MRQRMYLTYKSFFFFFFVSTSLEIKKCFNLLFGLLCKVKIFRSFLTQQPCLDFILMSNLKSRRGIATFREREEGLNLGMFFYSKLLRNKKKSQRGEKSMGEILIHCMEERGTFKLILSLQTFLCAREASGKGKLGKSTGVDKPTMLLTDDINHMGALSISRPRLRQRLAGQKNQQLSFSLILFISRLFTLSPRTSLGLFIYISTFIEKKAEKVLKRLNALSAHACKIDLV